jgi:uncharacterized membrane protein
MFLCLLTELDMSYLIGSLALTVVMLIMLVYAFYERSKRVLAFLVAVTLGALGFGAVGSAHNSNITVGWVKFAVGFTYRKRR